MFWKRLENGKCDFWSIEPRRSLKNALWYRLVYTRVVTETPQKLVIFLELDILWRITIIITSKFAVTKMNRSRTLHNHTYQKCPAPKTHKVFKPTSFFLQGFSKYPVMFYSTVGIRMVLKLADVRCSRNHI